MTIGRLTVVIGYLGAVYGPLSAIAHTTGQLQGALAGAKRVRAIFEMLPETLDAPDAIDATAVKGDVQIRGRRLQVSRTAPRCCATSRSRRSPAR